MNNFVTIIKLYILQLSNVQKWIFLRINMLRVTKMVSLIYDTNFYDTKYRPIQSQPLLT